MNQQENPQMFLYFSRTLEDIPDIIPRFARFPRSICTEMLACDKSKPVLCSACVREFNNLVSIKIDKHYQIILNLNGVLFKPKSIRSGLKGKIQYGTEYKNYTS